MNWKTKTLIFISVVVVSSIGYDALVIIKAGKAASISWTVIDLSHQFPLIPFLVGILCGHFFWQMEDPTKP